jgi:hypothetical protein
MVWLPLLGLVRNVRLSLRRLRNCSAMSVSEKSLSTVTAAVTALRKLFSFAGLLSVPVLAALSISALRNSCWCCMRAKSPRANCLRWRTQSSASSPFMCMVPFVNTRCGLWIDVMV